MKKERERRKRGRHTYIHTYIHTCIHTYIHTYIHTGLLESTLNELQLRMKNEISKNNNLEKDIKRLNLKIENDSVKIEGLESKLAIRKQLHHVQAVQQVGNGIAVPLTPSLPSIGLISNINPDPESSGYEEVEYIDKWVCKQCTFVNAPIHYICEGIYLFR